MKGGYTGDQTVTELQEYRRQIARIRSELRGLTEGLTEEQFAWRPVEGGWSIADCLSHLNLFGEQVEENLSAMMQEATAKGFYHAGPYRHGWFGWLGDLLIATVEPPYRIRFRAVKRLVPVASEPMEQTVRQFLSLQDRLDAFMEAAVGIDLAGVKRPLPPTNLRLTLGQWLALCLAHERRHLWQARQVRLRPDFPC